MKKTIRLVVFAFAFLLAQTHGFAALSQFTGNWKNADPNTRGVTALLITGTGDALKMRAWGKCHPQDCDWGEVDAHAYAPDVSSPMEPNARAVSALFTTGFSQTQIIVVPAGNNTIRAEVYTRFTDGSNRSNYTATHTFRRQLELAPIKPVPGLSLVPTVEEDCLSFNPATVTVKNVGGRWTIVDGNHLMFSFGDKRVEAMEALKVIRHYRMDRSCFVGRPDPSFKYLLVDGKAPSGSMPGEDSVSFNPNTIEVREFNGRWKIVDGSHWFFDFADKEAEARTAHAIIRKYGFTRSCFVGRPDPSFTYLRK